MFNIYKNKNKKKFVRRIRRNTSPNGVQALIVELRTLEGANVIHVNISSFNEFLDSLANHINTYFQDHLVYLFDCKVCQLSNVDLQ